ncbi:MAG TPA: sigma-70 family RNA polymerase sigma factor [Roseiarcus sp.]|nr:sigma-70 family RNA polymerase sigma factor [Roseiarcus sp.]
MGEAESDEDWAVRMRAALAGDEATYRRLLEEIGRSVRAMARGAFARSRSGDADVEDVVQETLLAIHLKRDTWDGGMKLAPWVGAIARHKIIDALRRRGARQFAPIDDFEAVIPAPEGDDPHDLSDADRLIGQLPARQQDIVRSISLQGQSIAATAKRLSMSEGAVRVALHRSLKALAAAWRRTAP